MKLKLSAFLVLVVLSLSSSAQLSKKTWLIGGNFNYSKELGYQGDGQMKQNLLLSSNVGYFPWDRVCVGVKLDGRFSKTTLNVGNGGKSKHFTTDFGVGPFARYYILPDNKKVNFLVEANAVYYRASFKTNGSTDYRNKYLQYEALLGPEVFLSKNVGLEVLAGYHQYKNLDTWTNMRTFQVKVGFQIHLSK